MSTRIARLERLAAWFLKRRGWYVARDASRNLIVPRGAKITLDSYDDEKPVVIDQVHQYDQSSLVFTTPASPPPRVVTTGEPIASAELTCFRQIR